MHALQASSLTYIYVFPILGLPGGEGGVKPGAKGHKVSQLLRAASRSPPLPKMLAPTEEERARKRRETDSTEPGRV